MNRESATMKPSKNLLSVLLLAAIGGLAACDRSALSSSQLTTANYDQVSNGMSKSQVETILGKPTTVETKEMSNFQQNDLSLRGREKLCDRHLQE